MPDTLSAATLRATLAGPIAVRALREGARGTVRAVFDRSFYVSLDAGWTCVGPEGLGPGPLNLLCGPWSADTAPPSALRPGDPTRVDNSILRAGAFAIPLAAAQPWHPGQPGVWNEKTLSRGLAAFAEALPIFLPSDGLARLLRSSEESDQLAPAVAAAQAPVQYLAWLLETSGSGTIPDIEADRLVPLMGLGPGLTPSGDDYLGGVMIALALTKRADLRDRVWQALERHLIACTSDISRAHLAAAAEGFGSAALHDLLAAVLTGATHAISPAITSVAAIGHTSGWDALAGAITVLRAA